MEENVNLEIVTGDDFLGITLSDSEASISVEIDDIESLKSLKEAINSVIRNLVKKE